MPSFHRYLWIAYCVPGLVVGPEETLTIDR